MPTVRSWPSLSYLKTMAALGKPVWGRFDIQLAGHHWSGVGGSNDELAVAFDADMHR